MNNESVKSINELLKELKEAVEEIKNIDAKDLIMDVRGPQLEGIETSLGHIEGLLKKETKSHEIESCLAELGDICLDVGGIAEGVRRKWKGAIQDKGKSDEERSAKLLENFFGKFKKVRDYVGDIEDNKFKGDYVGEGQLAEIYGYALDKNYLFSLDLEYKEYLKEDGEVKEEIKKAFEHKEIFFNKAIILKIKKYWIIEDGNKTYLINEDEDNKKLNIYAKTENTVEFVKKIATESKTKEKRIIDKKEYLLMLDFLKIFEKYYDKENIPAPQVYDYDETNKTIIMEKINGIVWMDIDKEKLIKNLPLVEELGRIIAIMHNHNYIHADFHDENVMLSSQNKWKIIDFEKSLYFLNEKINLKILNLEKTYLSDSADILFKRRKLVSKDGKVIVVSKDERIMLNTIMSSYFIGYLSNRNFKEIVNDIIEENDKQLEKFFFKLILTLIQEIRKSSQKVDNYLYNLITEIQYTIQKYHPDDSKLKTLFENFKNKISKNPNINLRISDEESMSIHSDEERQTPDQTSDAIQKQKAEITQQLKIIKEELNELKKLSEQKDQ